MKQYILTCVNEEKEVVSTQAFATLGEAQEQMIKEHNSHLHEFEDDDDYIEGHSLGEHYAHIYYGDNLEYHWEISNIDIPDSIIRSVIDTLFDNMAGKQYDIDMMRRIFNEEGKPDFGYFVARFNPLHTFYNSLDGENRNKFIKYFVK